MSLADKIKAVRQAEAECEARRLGAVESVATLKAELRRSATPGRIVVSGLALGFASGLKAPVGAAGSMGLQFLSGPMLSLVMDTVLPSVMAGMAAAAAAGAEENDEDPEASEDGESEGANDDAR